MFCERVNIQITAAHTFVAPVALRHEIEAHMIKYTIHAFSTETLQDSGRMGWPSVPNRLRRALEASYSG